MKAQTDLKTTRSRRDAVDLVKAFQGNQMRGAAHVDLTVTGLQDLETLFDKNFDSEIVPREV
jgi:hypothetical protein